MPNKWGKQSVIINGRGEGKRNVGALSTAKMSASGIPQTRLSHSISVSATRLNGQDRHAEYEILVDGKPVCWRRYREFDDLANALKREGIMSNKALPPKRIFGGNTPQVIGERKVGLEAWLSGLLSLNIEPGSPQATIIEGFLGVALWAEQSHSGKSGAGLIGVSAAAINPTDAKLHEIVTRFSSAATAPSPFSSLSKSTTISKDNVLFPVEDFDASEFRSSLESAENVFIFLKPTKV